MHILINISEEDYNVLHTVWESFTDTHVGRLLKAIYDGQQLPKGHGRLIDADEIQFENAEFDTYGDYCIAFDAIDQALTIIEADKDVENGNDN